jgi:hypothetical protein
MFQQLRDWVEKGIAPESSLVTFDGIDGTKWDRIICPHPQSARLQGDCANPQEASCWKCA